MTGKDFKRYIKAVQDICNINNAICDKCPYCYSQVCNDYISGELFNVEKFCQEVDEWCKENPAKTYKQDFLEKFPYAAMEENMHRPYACRNHIYGINSGLCSEREDCSKCWNEEISD